MLAQVLPNTESFFIAHWEVIISAVALIFNAGVMYRSLKDKPTESRVKEMLDEKFQTHCPFVDRINIIELQNKAVEKHHETVTKERAKETEINHLALQRIEINLKRVCEKIDISYIG